MSPRLCKCGERQTAEVQGHGEDGTGLFFEVTEGMRLPVAEPRCTGQTEAMGGAGEDPDGHWEFIRSQDKNGFRRRKRGGQLQRKKW